MRRFARCLAVGCTAFGLVGTSAPAVAQAVREIPATLMALRPGDTVKVWSSRPLYTGTVALFSDASRDSLSLRELPGRRALEGGPVVALSLVRRLEVQRGERRSGVGMVVGGTLGLVLGIAAGGALGIVIECGGRCPVSEEWAGATGLLTGAFVGGVIGLFGGASLGGRRQPQWHQVALSP